MVSTIKGLDERRFAWILVGVVVGGVVALALLDFFGTVAFAIFVYYASRPVQRFFEDVTDHPDLATTATMLTYVFPVVALLLYTGYVILQETAAFANAAAIPGLQSVLEPYLSLTRVSDAGGLLSQLRQNPNAVLDDQARAVISRLLGPVRTVFGVAMALFTRLFLLFVFVFYLLRDDAKIAHWFRQSVDHDATIVEFAEEVDRDLADIFWGNFMTIAATGAIAIGTYFVFDFLVSVQTVVFRPILLGALLAFGTLIPVVGMVIIYLPVTAVLAFQAVAGDIPMWYPIAYLVITFVVIDVVPDYFVRAYLSAGRVYMGLILLAYVLGTMAFGWGGLFLGPIVLVVFVTFAREVFPDLMSRRRVR